MAGSTETSVLTPRPSNVDQPLPKHNGRTPTTVGINVPENQTRRDINRQKWNTGTYLGSPYRIPFILSYIPIATVRHLINSELASHSRSGWT